MPERRHCSHAVRWWLAAAFYAPLDCAARRSDAQRTHFRKPLDFDKARISALEADLAKLISGGALNRPGETEVTITEEWV